MSRRLFFQRAAQARGGGFSLLELLVSMAILSLLLVILLSMVSGTTKLWRQSENKVDTFREARAALNVINTDLSSVLISKKPNLFQQDLTADMPDSAIPPPKANNLFFVTSLPSDSQDPARNRSELCIVGYFLAYDSPTFGKVDKSLNLYRYFRSSDDSAELLKGEASLAKDISTSASSAEVEVLARNVTGLKIRAFTVDDSGTVTELPKNSTTTPDFVDIQITALNNESAVKMKEEDWHNVSSPRMKPIFSQNARTFSTRVNIAPYISK